MVEPFSLDDEFSSHDLRNNLQCSMTITTNTKILKYFNGRTSRTGKETFSNSKSLTVGKESIFFLFVVCVMQRISRLYNIASFFHLHSQTSKQSINLIILWIGRISSSKFMDSDSELLDDYLLLICSAHAFLLSLNFLQVKGQL